MNKAFSLVEKPVSFLILNFNRADNLYCCLDSIKKNIKFDYDITVLTNGGILEELDKSYVLFRNSFIDKLILSSRNEGSSLGVLRLIKSCTNKYFILIQGDAAIKREINKDELDGMIRSLESGFCGAVDWTGLVPRSCKFSERAFMAKTEFYLSCLDKFSGYGTGPFYNPSEDNSEQTMDKFIYESGKVVSPWSPQLTIDTGKYSIFETPCGGIFRRRNDSHQVWVIKKPERKIDLYDLTDEEWDIILAGEWVGGTIPQKAINKAFYFYSSGPDPKDK